MSPSPQVNKNRYRVNSYSSNNDYSNVENQQTVSAFKQDKSNKKIPLILKNMNSVEKYIHDFKNTQMLQKQHKILKEQSPLYDPQLSNSRHIKKLLQKTPSQLNDHDLKELQQKCYIKYSSISQQDYGTKYQLLQNAQTQYVKLKHSIHVAGITQKSSLPKQFKHSRAESMNTNYKHSSSPGMQFRASFVNPKSIYLLNKKKMQEQYGPSEKINQNDIEKQLKTSVIEEGGKKYFADLYLMKRERDKMLKEIFGKTEKNKDVHALNQKNKEIFITNEKNKTKQNFNIQNPTHNTIQGESMERSNTKSLQKSMKKLLKNQQSKKVLNNEQPKKFPKLKINIPQLPRNSYEQKMRAQQQNFIQQKILRDRSQKKEKMLKGRNMNWNVYYEMLALSKNEKEKIKEYCKFSQTYGED